MKARFLFPFAAALLLACPILHAESTDPELVEGKLPAYTEDAREEGIEGTIVLEALVDENGKVFAADVVESVNPDLDSLTLAAVRNWTFKPATEDGKAIMKVVRIPIHFNLIDPMQETVLRAHDRAIASR